MTRVLALALVMGCSEPELAGPMGPLGLDSGAPPMQGEGDAGGDSDAELVGFGEDSGVDAGSSVVDAGADSGSDAGLCTTSVWFRDANGDGWGDTGTATVSCEKPGADYIENEPCPAPNFYYTDNDGDGHHDGQSPIEVCGEMNGPYTLTNSRDCDDDNADAHPGQTAWFSSPRSNGSYDYNCDNKQDRETETIAACSGSTGVFNDGWEMYKPAPACGTAGNWRAFVSACIANQDTRMQRCR